MSCKTLLAFQQLLTGSKQTGNIIGSGAQFLLEQCKVFSLGTIAVFQRRAVRIAGSGGFVEEGLVGRCDGLIVGTGRRGNKWREEFLLPLEADYTDPVSHDDHTYFGWAPVGSCIGEQAQGSTDQKTLELKCHLNFQTKPSSSNRCPPWKPSPDGRAVS